MTSTPPITHRTSKATSRSSDSNILSPEFFARPSVTVAKELLGKFLVRDTGGETLSAMITEVEVYDGLKDLASHARFGKTARNTPMFGPAGHWYVYFCYGVHWMLNIVTREPGYPAAILIRGIEGAAGPGKLTKFMKIDGTLSGKPADEHSGLWIEDRGTRLPRGSTKTSARIGVDYAGPWAHRHLRFFIEGGR